MSWKRDQIEVEWYVEEDINTSEKHESNESNGGNVATAWKQGPELGTVFLKANDSRDRVGGSEKADDDRWNVKDKICGPTMIWGRVTAKIFINIKSMTLNDIVYIWMSGKCK